MPKSSDGDFSGVKDAENCTSKMSPGAVEVSALGSHFENYEIIFLSITNSILVLQLFPNLKCLVSKVIKIWNFKHSVT